MTYQEKRSIVNIISTLLISSIYYWYVFQTFTEETMNSEEILRFWGTTIFIYIPVTLGAKIIIHIVFAIVNSIATKEKMPYITDERAKLIELKSTRNAYYMFVFVYIITMGGLAFGMSLNVMFIILICSGIVSDIFENMSQIHFHRKGV